MSGDLNDKLEGWFMSLDPINVGEGQIVPLGTLIEEVNGQLHHLADQLYCDYEPTRGAHPDFWQRLARWLDNVTRIDQQQELFRLLPHVFFAGPREFDSLYRTAFNHQIATWLIDQLNLVIDDESATGRLQSAVSTTWFCPITDSMRINAFYHLNRIEGRDHRPDWRCLARFADTDRVLKYIEDHGIERIVLLEDFVGNGSQIRKAVEFAAGLPSHLPVLVVPLIACPAADEIMRDLQDRFAHLKFDVCLRLPEAEFLQAAPQPGERALFAAVRIIALEVETAMKRGLSIEQLKQANKYFPFGWHGTGALVVLHTNCPNNTLPIIFHKSQEWEPLFPRSSRV